MHTDSITFIDNGLTPAVWAEFQRIAGWGTRPAVQYKRALEKSLFSVTAVLGDKTVAIGRLIGDGVTDWYVKDIIVRPEYQRSGIGRAVMEYLLSYISRNSLPGTTVTVTLLAALGKEPFYQKLGFRTRPNDREGAGMIMNLAVRSDIDGSR